MGTVKEIFISTDPQETRVAVTENKRLEEFYVERSSDTRMVGSIYKGRVTSVVPGIGAAFVDIGLGKNGFLYVADIVEPKPDEDAILEGEPPGEAQRQAPQAHHRRSRIEDIVKVNQELLVQVVKEPFGTKGARLTTHISLPGRYMVLMGNDSRMGISKRIEDPQERGRLREILAKLRFSQDAGLIIRTAGIGKGEKEFARDVRYLSKIYQDTKRLSARAKAPVCAHQEYALAQRVIRDSFTEDTHRVVVDSKEEFHRLRRFLQVLIPGVKVRLDLYRGTEPLFGKEGLEEQIVGLFDKRVQLPSGGSIVIEPTESLVAIDVNTSKFTGRRNLEETAFQVDQEAAVEVARQLRLRDIGGIVVIDFIDLDVPTHRRELVTVLQEALARDRAKTNLVSFSEICVAELTRQRMRRSVETVSHQACPYCNGRGTIKSAVTMAIEAIRQAKRALKNAQDKTLELLVHPQVAVRLLQEDRPSLSALEAHSRSKILVLSDPSLHFEQIKVNVTSQ
ncbi:MAG: Rne/Rng family ribonuclease [Candidatus Omnitrophica bacterium]|nr:Rne/Rng family ribonuclease [Candidatus Omnitrophota bacterium]